MPSSTLMKITQLTYVSAISELYTMLQQFVAGFICHDDRCHLKIYACNSEKKMITPTAKRISQMNIVVDKLHFKGHVDKWCHENCNPYNFHQLGNVSTLTMYVNI